MTTSIERVRQVQRLMIRREKAIREVANVRAEIHAVSLILRGEGDDVYKDTIAKATKQFQEWLKRNPDA
jgi:hypothetical protein